PERAEWFGPRVFAAGAAAVVAACVVVAFVFRAEPVAPSAGSVIAVAAGTAFEGDAVEIEDVVRVGDVLALTKGFLSIEIGPGATLDVVAPAKVRVLSDRAVWLGRGLIAAAVGPAGHGFEVRTDDAVIVDLGTRFQVHKDESYGTQLRVTEGKVLATLKDDDGRDVKRLELLAGQSSRLDRVTASADKIDTLFDFDAAYATVSAAKGDVRKFSGAAKPLSGEIVGLDLRVSGLDTRGYAYVIPEARGVVFDEAVTLATLTGEVTVPAGLAIDSYLVHFDNEQSKAFEENGYGRLAFGSDVVAVIGSDEALAATDPRFGSPGTRYETRPSRGTEADDDISVVGDGRSVKFDLRVDARFRFDEFRVLVVGAP
ncbi:MAG: FecR domain-containing protein, partial [Planctomycetota bacterium]